MAKTYNIEVIVKLVFKVVNNPPLNPGWPMPNGDIFMKKDVINIAKESPYKDKGWGYWAYYLKAGFDMTKPNNMTSDDVKRELEFHPYEDMKEEEVSIDIYNKTNFTSTNHIPELGEQTDKGKVVDRKELTIAGNENFQGECYQIIYDNNGKIDVDFLCYAYDY